jgi:hypothetical protein
MAEILQVPNLITEVFVSPEPNPESLKLLGSIFIWLLILLVTGVILHYGITLSRTPPITSYVDDTKGARMEQIKNERAYRNEGFEDKASDPYGSKSLYNDLIKTLSKNEQYLVNICPLTASIGGYIGTSDPKKPGIFYSEFYVQSALRAGIRSFVLPISIYLDDNKTPPNWPYSGDPAVVVRDTNGKVISNNAISVKQFCTDIVRYNSLNATQATEPIFLFILEDTANLPDYITKEKDYAKILRKLGDELKVIPESMRLTTLGSYGSAVGSENEGTILTQIPLSQLQSKVIIFTNFKTKIGLKPEYSNNNPTLHNYVNFTIKPIVAQNAGINVGGGARSLKLSDVSGSQIDWKEQTRTVIHITSQDYYLTNPDPALVDGAIKAGIQVIPVPFFADTPESVKPILDQWKGYAWRLKEDRYVKPEPVVPANPSTKMNARVSPDKQPGQVVVG